MTLFGEPIGTWLSIAAFLISFSALMLARRKQHAEERAMLAHHLSELKSECADALLVINRIDSLVSEFNSIYMSLPSHTRGHKESPLAPGLALIESTRSQWTGLYDKIGKIDPIVTDPVTLSSIVVDARHLKDNLNELHAAALENLGPIVKKFRFEHLNEKKSRGRSVHTRVSPKLEGATRKAAKRE